ncbi:MAG: phytoene desaturase family protein [Nitrospinota bacterium]
MASGKRTERYDIIVIGAGHNGLTLACYLAKAGLKTIVLERLPYPGGGVTSREAVPGFLFSLHAVNHNWVHIGPIRRDLELERFGSRYVFPPSICSHLFSDRRSLTLHRSLEKTVSEIARFSANDSVRYRDWIREHEATFEFLARMMFAPPDPPSQIWGRLEATPSGRRILKAWLMSIQDVAEDLFENECVKVWFVNYCLQTIQDPFAKGSGLIPVSLLVNQHRSAGNSLAVGGSRTLTDSLVACLKAHGGTVRTGCHVSRIVIEGGRAKGLILSDGTEIEAVRAIASNVEPQQVFQKMVDPGELSEEFREQIRCFRFSYFTIFGVHLALHVDPRYRTLDEGPNQAFNVMLGADTMDDVRKHFYDLGVGVPPEPPGYMVVHPSRFDPSIAPPGKHYALLWQYAPCELKGGNERWDEIKEDYAGRCMDLYRRSTENVDEKAVVGQLVYTPLDIARENISMVGGDMVSGRITQDQMGIFRPFHGYPPYRTPIEGLYLCGPSTHPRGGCHGANGYNAAGAIAEDFRIDKWWTGTAYDVLKPAAS